jgi:hypothetical protein
MQEEEISGLINLIPLNYIEYFNYQELISRMDKRSVFEKKHLGYSTQQTEIFGYTMGKGPIKVLIYGLPHSDEPIGTMTIDALSELVSNNRELENDFTFFFIPCIDPDGLYLNRGWLKGPFNQKKFFLNRYHRPDKEDIDWSFPINTKNYSYSTTMNETNILRKIIDSYKPELFVTLHSIQFSGIHFYFSNNYVTLFDKIESFVEKSSIPLQKGTPFFIEDGWTYRPGFYRIYTTKEMISDYIREGIDISTLRRGEFSAGYYLEQFPKGIVLVPEVPLYHDLELNNLEKGEKTKKEVFLESNRIMLETLDYIKPIWNKFRDKLNNKNPHFFRIAEIIKNWRKEIKEEMKITRKEGSDELATKSEIYSNEKVVKYNSCNTLGSFHQLLKDSKVISKNERNSVLLQLENEIESISHDVESKTNIQNSDINEMVRIQVYSILATMNFIKKRKKSS